MIKVTKMNESKGSDKGYKIEKLSTELRDFYEKVSGIRKLVDEYDKTFDTKFMKDFNEVAKSISKFKESLEGDYFENHYTK